MSAVLACAALSFGCAMFLSVVTVVVAVVVVVVVVILAN